MSHAQNPRNRRSQSTGQHNAEHFLYRERLDDAELSEWITTAFGQIEEFRQLKPEQAMAIIKNTLEKKVKADFGEKASLRSLVGMMVMLDTMVTGIEAAQGNMFDRKKQMPAPLRHAYELMSSLICATESKPLNRIGMDRLRNGGKILDEVGDYAREAALVLPMTLKSQDARDQLRPYSHGMPEVDIKFSFMAREYNEHIRPSIPSWSITGRI
jgi:hypothetical protein